MRATLRLRLGKTGARAELVRLGRVLWRGEAEFATAEELEEAVAQLAAQEGLPARPAALSVELEPPLAQLRTLRGIPPVRRSQLRSLVAMQAARFFRRNGRPLVTDACWPTRDARRQGRALAAAAEEHWLDAVVRGAQAAGLAVASLAPAGLPAGVRLALLPQSEGHRRRIRERRQLRLLVVAAGLCWMATAGIALGRFHQERARVEREIARLEAPARALREARRAVLEASEMVETVESGRRERATVLADFVSLAAALPDSAFVTSLVLNREGGGRMAVMARSSAAVLVALDRVGLAGARIEGGVARERAGESDRERFTVVFGAGGAR